MNIILIGPQGSGKGTQARLLAEKLGVYCFEMGNFLRKLAEKDPMVNEIVNKKGELLPDDMFFFAMKELLGEKISDGKGVILDGFPRTVSQYGLLKNWFSGENMKVDMAIFLDIGEKETIKRLSARRVCESCGEVYNLITNPPSGGFCKCGGKLIQRDDDKPEQIKTRLEIFKQNTKPLLDLFQKDGILYKINGERPIKEIHEDIISELEG